MAPNLAPMNFQAPLDATRDATPMSRRQKSEEAAWWHLSTGTLCAAAPVIFFVLSHFLSWQVFAVTLVVFVVQRFTDFGVSERPRVRVGASPVVAALAAQSGLHDEVFRPTPWAINSHLQTALFAGWSGFADVFGCGGLGGFDEQETLVDKVGSGSVDLCWWHRDAKGKALPEDAPIILLIPGVIGRPAETNQRRFAAYATKRGFRVAVKSWRALGAPIQDGPVATGAGSRVETWGWNSVADLDTCVRRVHAKFPAAAADRLVGVGVSFGGALLTTYLGLSLEQRQRLGYRGMTDGPRIRAGASVSGLFDAHRIQLNLDALPVYLPYSYILNEGIMQALGPRGRAAVEKDLERPKLWSSLWLKKMSVYHEAVTVALARISRPSEGAAAASREKESGVLGLAELYSNLAQLHSRDALTRVTTPLLAFMADDDPLCPAVVVDPAMRLARESPGIVTLRTRRGGHCGFFEGLRGTSWSDKVVCNFLDAALEC